MVKKKQKNLKNVNFALLPYEINGYISLESYHSKEFQFIYVNNRHVLKTKLHKIINLLLKKYLLINHRGIKDNTALSPSKNYSQHAIFILNIKCPFNKYDIYLEPQKSLIEFKEWRLVLKCLQKTVYAFLIDNGITDKTLSYDQLFDSIVKNDICDNEDIDIHNTKKALFSLTAKRFLFDEIKLENNKNLNDDDKSFQNNINKRFTEIEKNTEIINKVQISTLKNSNRKKICIDASNDDDINTLTNLRKKNTNICEKLNSREAKSHKDNTKDDPSKNVKPNDDIQMYSMNQFQISTFDNSIIRNKICISNHETVCTLTNLKKNANKNLHLRENKFIKRKNTMKLSASKKPELDRNTFQVIKKNVGLIKLKKISGNIKNVYDKSKLYMQKNKSVKINENDDDLNSSDSINKLRNNDKMSYINSEHNFDENTSTMDIDNNVLNSELTNYLDETNQSIKICLENIKLTPEIKLIPNKSYYKCSLSKIEEITENNWELNSCKEKKPNQSKINSQKNISDEFSVNPYKPSHSEYDHVTILNDTNETCSNKNANNNVENNWICHKYSDKFIYINMINGNSAYFSPEIKKLEDIRKTDYQEKSHFFLSHNATPFLLPSLKRNADQSKVQISASKMAGEKISGNILDMLHKWKNPIFHKEDHNEVCDISIKKISKTAIKVYNLTQPHSMSKTDLNHAKVIGQVDCKFIACLIPKIEKFKARDLIVLFDQHAVHERICLEKLIEDLYENDSVKQNIKSTSIDIPITVHMRPEEMRVLEAYKSQLDKFGLKVTVDKNIANIHCIPTCLFEKISNENKKKLIESNTLIENLLQESVQMLQQTGGWMFSLPKTLLAVLNTQACRSAIKFGDPLSKDECCKLLGLLALCKLPFQCAHGRPDLVPIADLDQLKKSESSMEKLQLFKLNRR